MFARVHVFWSLAVSAIGTGIAAAVAQTGLQSQQVSRQRDKREANRTRQAQRDTEVFQTRLLGLEELDGDEDATRLHVDNQQPDREHPDDQRAENQAEAEDKASERAGDSAAIAQASRLPDAQTLLQRLADTADPGVKKRAAARRDPGGTDRGRTGGGAEHLYAHIDIQA